MARSIANVVHCSTAEEFFESISPRGPYFASEGPELTWVYRGHSSDQYKLVPTALREDKPLAEITQWNCESNASQMEAEKKIITEFFWLSDKCGLHLPEDSQELRDEVESLNIKVGIATEWQGLWPPKRLLSLVGLMQHFGLPTRLLDWSGNYLVAAYFAAREAADPGTSYSDQRLAVWAFCLHAYRLDKIMSKYFGTGLDVLVVTSPSASNSNLRAQHGLFTLYNPPSIKFNEPVDRRGLDEILQANMYILNQDQIDDKPVSPIMYRFTLPVDESGKLLWLLAKEGVTAASIFPGYGGVAQAIKEQLLWERPGSNDNKST